MNSKDHLSAADSSAASGSVIPARPTIPAEWQPIATAPKGELSILLLMGGLFVSVGRWDKQEHYQRAVAYWKSERGLLYGKTWDRENQPTHWMPLPALPPLTKQEPQ